MNLRPAELLLMFTLGIMLACAVWVAAGWGWGS